MEDISIANREHLKENIIANQQFKDMVQCRKELSEEENIATLVNDIEDKDESRIGNMNELERGPQVEEKDESKMIDINEFELEPQVEHQVDAGSSAQQQEKTEKIKIIFDKLFNKEAGTFQCDHCDFNTKRMKNGYIHVLKMHNNLQKKYNCDSCDYTAIRTDSLKYHIIAKHSSIRFDCDECDYQTAYMNTLKKHKRIKHHNGLKPHVCDACVFRTTHKYDLLNHKVNIHGAKKLECNLCDFSAVSESFMKRHKKSSHITLRIF